MNKLGFTLIELLVSIAIISLIVIITNINIIKIHDETQNNYKTAQNNIITTAACTFIELNKNKELKEQCLNEGCTISSTILIEEGILDAKNVDKETLINIKKVNNEKTCSIK